MVSCGMHTGLKVPTGTETSVLHHPAGNHDVVKRIRCFILCKKFEVRVDYHPIQFLMKIEEVRVMV